jgi:hypothetical protein
MIGMNTTENQKMSVTMVFVLEFSCPVSNRRDAPQMDKVSVDCNTTLKVMQLLMITKSGDESKDEIK